MASSRFTGEFIPPKGGNVDGIRILKNWGGSNWNFYMNDPDGKTIAINLGPTSSSVNYNVWAGNSAGGGSAYGGDNIAQVRYGSYSYSYYYYLKDHLGNVRMTLSSTGSIYTWNDFYPFGESMPGRNVFEAGPDTRYQYTSKERDVETGLDYFGARYYDGWRGQWLSVDPMAEKYPGWSPYNYATDNSILLVDPNGAEPSDFYDENGNLVRHINDGSNAVYRQRGAKQQLHYEFAGYDSKQGGANMIKLKSAIQEAQRLNNSNSYLHQSPKGQSYCNFGTQNVLNTVGSALGINLNFPGQVWQMAQEIENSGYFRRVDEQTAALNAQGSLSLVLHLGPREHSATFSTGENGLIGPIANIGLTTNTGFVTLNSTIAPSRSKEYFILELSKILYTDKEY